MITFADMEAKIKKSVLIDQPQIPFFTRILGEQATVVKSIIQFISKGIQIRIFHFSSNTIDIEPEEKTYLHFYPVEAGKSYLQLTFFPEFDLKKNVDNYTLFEITYFPEFFNQWTPEILEKIQPFQFDRSTEQAINLPPCCREPIDFLFENKTKDDILIALRQNEIALFLLRLSLEAFSNNDEACKMPACSFLSNSNEREKVLEAHTIILKRLDNPITIRELARQIGMNECYLKKGFKAMFGKTIHELQQFERIEMAKSLLKLNQYSITEVAYKMGFGSASHFSTSFKRIAGMKPCELLG